MSPDVSLNKLLNKQLSSGNLTCSYSITIMRFHLCILKVDTCQPIKCHFFWSKLANIRTDGSHSKTTTRTSSELSSFKTLTILVLKLEYSRQIMSVWSLLMPRFLASPYHQQPSWPTWGQPGSCRTQMGPMLAPWTLLLRSAPNNSLCSLL